MHLNDFELKFVFFFSLSRKIDKEEEKKIAKLSYDARIVTKGFVLL